MAKQLREEPTGEPTRDSIKEMAISGTHAMVMSVLAEVKPAKSSVRVLDIGAGEGGVSLRLRDAGYGVSACDLFPEMFKVPGIQCRQVDANGVFPYEDGSFDLAIAVELVEHIEDQRKFFTEVARLLKPGGIFLFTTPNILSLKSRLLFFFTGYFYSFGPLNLDERDPVRQHLSPLTLDWYRWALDQCGLELNHVTTDRFQNSSLLLSALAPFIKLNSFRKYGRKKNVQLQNSSTVLFGRKLVGIARKRAS